MPRKKRKQRKSGNKKIISVVIILVVVLILVVTIGLTNLSSNYASKCADFYCDSVDFDMQISEGCADGKVRGSDNECHFACGGIEFYCEEPEAQCLEDQCKLCPEGYTAYEDGKCYSNVKGFTGNVIGSGENVPAIELEASVGTTMYDN